MDASYADPMPLNATSPASHAVRGPSLAAIVGMALADRLPWGPVQHRVPEPSCPMIRPDQVEAFAAQADGAGALRPLYLLNALACHALLPIGGRVLELGCGSAGFLTCLARCRPDADLTGYDLSEPMLAEGRRRCASAGVAERIRLERRDMTGDLGAGRFDLIVSLFSLHHLPTQAALAACLGSIARHRHGAAVWIFDHRRPRRAATAARFPALMTPDAPAVFRDDSANSLRAAWSLEEVAAAVTAAFPGRCRSSASRILPVYQAWWQAADSAGARGAWSAPPESPTIHRDLRRLRRLFPAWPEAV